jgi:hypothetical protein
MQKGETAGPWWMATHAWSPEGDEEQGRSRKVGGHTCKMTLAMMKVARAREGGEKVYICG